MTYKVNLNEFEDKLEGKWWHYFRISDFAYMGRIPNQEEVDVEDDDFFIHKQMDEEKRFPMKVYHVIMDGEPFEIDGKEIRIKMSEYLVVYIQKHKKLPFACTFNKLMKNNTVVVNYNPNSFDNFQLKIPGKEFDVDPEELEEFFTNLEVEKKNELGSDDDITFQIDSLSEAPIIEQIASESGGKVYVFNSEIETIDKRISVFQGNETVFFLILLKNGQAASDVKKSTLKRDFDLIVAKSSKNAFEKYELKVGDKVSFNGKLKNDKKLGLLLQNIRKFEKQ
jgi:hypothetical protein